MTELPNLCWLFGVALVLALPANAQHTLIENHQPRAQIVIAPEPPRLVRLAAEELQTHLEAMSGARLPIAETADDSYPIQIYIGSSSYTDELGVDAEGLRHGAWRMLSRGDDLVLIGHDTDYTPKEPYLPRLGPRESHRMTPEVLAEWDRLTGREWSFPHITNFRNFNRELGIWSQDEGGSLQAVYGLLRDLGIRWYLPDELGTVIPSRATIVVPRQDRTVEPDFAVRLPYQLGRRYAQTSRDEVLWQLRLGFNQPTDILGEDWTASIPHGLKFVSTGRRRDELVAKHPDWFALYSGKREAEKHCLSSTALFQEMVDFVRFMFDHYDAPIVSVMPTDGFANICQCDKCAGKSTPERGRRGQLSDYVWEFVDRLAREVYKTHPAHRVSCFAYGSYLLPPLEITTLSPNLVIGICQTRSTFIDPDQRERYVDQYRQGWRELLPEGHKDQMLTWDYYLYAGHGNGLPVYFPRIIAADLRELQGQSLGEFIEFARYPDDAIGGLAIQHLNLYVQSRLWWDADLDLESLLTDYYRTYYGPAAQPMQAFIEYAEVHYPRMSKDAAVLATALDLFETARQAAPAGSVYQQRLQLVADYMEPLWPLREQLQRNVGLDRSGNPEAWGGYHESLTITLDGQGTEPVWERWYYLLDMTSGERPNDGAITTVSAAWDAQANTLYFRIVCNEPDMAELPIGTTVDGDTGIFLGDFLELHIETQEHAYYQIVLNPAGELVDIDRGDQGIDYDWSSGAEAAAFRGKGHWAIELRIPVIDPAEAALEPDGDGVVGLRPTRQLPWYINICRQRVRGDTTSRYALSPSGKRGFHSREALGRFYVGGKRPGVIRALERREQRALELEQQSQ